MEQKRKTQRTQTIRYLVSLLLYGTNGVAAHFLQLSSMQIVLLRTSFGWLVLTLALLLGQKTRQSAQRQDVLFVLLSGVCSTGLGSYLYFSSIPLSSGARGVGAGVCGALERAGIFGGAAR